MGRTSQYYFFSILLCQWWEHNNGYWKKPEFSQRPKTRNKCAWSGKELHSGESFERQFYSELCISVSATWLSGHMGHFDFAFDICYLPSLQQKSNHILTQQQRLWSILGWHKCKHTKFRHRLRLPTLKTACMHRNHNILPWIFMIPHRIWSLAF